ncbi:MAG: hypothetical protein R2789_09720 [Microthrixaceae bacterium]
MEERFALVYSHASARTDLREQFDGLVEALSTVSQLGELRIDGGSPLVGVLVEDAADLVQ